MTRRDILKNYHEPFGDAFYFGPEFLSQRFKDDAAYRQNSGSGNKTYRDVIEDFQEAEREVSLSLSRLFV